MEKSIAPATAAILIALKPPFGPNNYVLYYNVTQAIFKAFFLLLIAISLGRAFPCPLSSLCIFRLLLKSKQTRALELISRSYTELKQKGTACLLQNKTNIWHLSHSYVTKTRRTNSCVSASLLPFLHDPVFLGDIGKHYKRNA